MTIPLMSISKTQLPFSQPPGSLCILRLSAVGDVCHTLAVVRTIQSHWPQTQLTWIIGKLEASLVGDIPGIEFIIFDKSAGWQAYKSLYRQLRKRHFDALLHMQISIRSSLASRLVHTPIRLGFDRARAKDYQWLFTNHQITALNNQHVLDGLFGFAQALGIHQKHLRWDIPLPPEALQYADQHTPGNKRFVVISPCSSARFRNWRNWHPKGYAGVCNYLSSHLGYATVLTGGPSALEKEYGDEISKHCDQVPVNLIGKTNLKQLLAIIAQAAAVISPDSGPAHMATTVGTPVIGLYVTSNPQRTGPYLSQEWVINKYPDAIHDESGKTADEVPWGTRVRNPNAMQRISLEDITTKLDALLAHHKTESDT